MDLALQLAGPARTAPLHRPNEGACMHAIEFEGLTKDYGNGRGLFDLDLHIRRGEVVGFLGPNGAGKTTTIRLLLAMIRPTRGTARILGRDVTNGSTSLKRDIGYLPGELPEFGRLRCSEIVGYYEGMRESTRAPASRCCASVSRSTFLAASRSCRAATSRS
jgi:ABC-type multidrug transport system ATPase subunit